MSRQADKQLAQSGISDETTNLLPHGKRRRKCDVVSAQTRDGHCDQHMLAAHAAALWPAHNGTA